MDHAPLAIPVSAESIALALVLGLVQGVLEWIPVSSSAQVTALALLAGVDPAEAYGLSLSLHLGTGLAALLAMRSELKRIVREDRGSAAKLLVPVALSFAVAAPIGLLFEEFLGLAGPAVLLALLGVLLLLTSAISRKSKAKRLKSEPTLASVLVAGVGQGLSVLPGVSRSAVTFSILLIAGVAEESALKWSYLLGIPAVIAAGLYGSLRTTASLPLVALGNAISLLAGLASIETMMRLVRATRYDVITAILGLLYIATALLLGIPL